MILEKGLNGFFQFQLFLVSEGPNIMAHISLFHVALKKPNHDSKAGWGGQKSPQFQLGKVQN